MLEWIGITLLAFIAVGVFWPTAIDFIYYIRSKRKTPR